MSWTKFFKAVGKALAAASAGTQTPQRRSIPLMTMDMIQTDGAPITAAQAVKLFKEFALKSGYLEKDELSDHAGYFSDEMKEHAASLEEDAIGDIASLKDRIKELKALRKGETDTDKREELDEEIQLATLDLEEETRAKQPAVAALAAFKADKRQFLIDYMNAQTQRQ